MSDSKLHGFFFEPPIDKYFLGYQFNEIYRENVYAPFFKDKRNLTVIDVGANIGITTYYFARHAKIVHAIEPSMEHFKVLKYMIDFNKLENVELHKLAIWIKNKTGKLYHNFENKTMYSLHMAVQDNLTLPEDVKITTLDKFYEDNKITHCDFLKLDVEGSEFEILGGEGFRKIAPITDTVFLEWHKWAERNPSQIIQSLENNGFKAIKPESSPDLLVGVKNDPR